MKTKTSTSKQANQNSLLCVTFKIKSHLQVLVGMRKRKKIQHLQCLLSLNWSFLKTKINLHYTYKDTVSTPQRTQWTSIRRCNQLMLYREITAVVRIIQNIHIQCIGKVQLLVLKVGVHAVTTSL
jgi:hypothetical protein